MIFIMGAATSKSEGVEKARGGMYNNWCSRFCGTNSKFKFVDVDSLVLKGQIIEGQYLTPAGYRALSTYIMNAIKLKTPVMMRQIEGEG